MREAGCCQEFRAAASENAGHGEIPDGRACVEAGTALERCGEIPAETRAYVAAWRPLLEAAGYGDARREAAAR